MNRKETKGETKTDRQFRLETRDWLAANCPQEMRTPMPQNEAIHGGSRETANNPVSYQWLRAMASRGWTAPHWPSEYGGGGLNQSQFQILIDEMKHLGARPPLLGMGLTMIGPTLLEYGTQAQKQKHLPAIIRGETRWCQGYSEPGAGSDLANLATRAEDRGDHYLVNGSKIWTSGAHHADWMFALVRTDPSTQNKPTRQKGISFLLIDMTSAGVDAHPIRLIDGNSHFCQTFLTNVEVEKANLVGEVNKGWTVGKRLLQHERSGLDQLLGTGVDRTRPATPLAVMAKQSLGETRDGKIDDAEIRNKIINQNLEERCFALTQKRAVEESAANTPGAATSIFKLRWAPMVQQQLELQLLLRGTQGLGWEGEHFDEEALSKGRLWLEPKAASIAGGSNEVQCNIIAKHVLGLPD